MATGVHRFESPTAAEPGFALALGRRDQDSGADLPDLIVMSMAYFRKCTNSNLGFPTLSICGSQTWASLAIARFRNRDAIALTDT